MDLEAGNGTDQFLWISGVSKSKSGRLGAPVVKVDSRFQQQENQKARAHARYPDASFSWSMGVPVVFRPEHGKNQRTFAPEVGWYSLK